MNYRELKLHKTAHDVPAHLSAWQSDVTGPECVLQAVRELLEASSGVNVIKFACGGHPTDKDQGKIEKLVTIAISDDPELLCKLRYCGENDNPLGAGSSGVHCYTFDAAENAISILWGMKQFSNIYRLEA